MAQRRLVSLQRVLGVNELFATAYGNVGSSIYYALGLVAGYALGLTPVVFLITGLLFFATASSYAEATAMYPEAGGSSSFARHAFNEFAAFVAAWGQMLTYVITVATSAYFVPHYLGVLWEPLRSSPGDIIGGALVIAALMVLNVVGTKESARLNVTLAVVDFFTQVVIVVAGVVLVLDPAVLASNVEWGVAPGWNEFLLAIPIGMVAYTGIETISNMAEEAKDERRSIPAAIKRVEIAVFAIYFTLPAVALSALPVIRQDGEFVTKLGLPESEGGFQGDPILGVVAQIDLGFLNQPVQLYVGLLGATILLLAANAGMIGVSRLVYSMGLHRQLPDRMRRLHPAYGTPWVGIIVFGAISVLALLPGQATFLGNLYAFGAMLSFTVAHAALVRLRFKYPAAERAYRAPVSLRIGGVDLPALAILGGIGTGLAFVVLALRNVGGISFAGFGWLLAGAVAYPIARRRMGLDLTTTVKAPVREPVVASETEYASVVVWFDDREFNLATLATAARLAAKKDGSVSVLVTHQVPNASPLDAVQPQAESRARAIFEQARLLTGGRAGVTALAVRAGQEGRVIVERAREAHAEAVVLALPRGAVARGGFGRAAETVLEQRPCRVILDTPAARDEGYGAESPHGPAQQERTED